MHIGIIMDGNGRWATERGLPRTTGHKVAIERIDELIREAEVCGVSMLTLYAFAKKNWKRDTSEVAFIWYLFDQWFGQRASEMLENGARLCVIGDRTGIPGRSLTNIEKVEIEGENNRGLLVQLALNYDGEDEVMRATQKLANEVQRGELQPDQIDLEKLKAKLDTAGGADPDILIRTGVDENRDAPDGYAVWRSSSFLQLQSAQAVCVSCTTRFPDFTVEHLRTAIELAKPESRLFGGQRK